MDSCPADNGLSTLFMAMTTLINTQTSEHLGPASKLKDGAQYDFIIVGAGSAGCVLANRLSENPKWSIILLEAGGEESKEASIPGLLDYNYGSRLDWKYEAMAQQRSCGGEPCLYPRGKVLGGSSVLNSMVYTRGWRKDYDNWAAAGSDGWDFESVLPYFKKSENNMDPKFLRNKKYHSTGGFLPVGQFPYKDDNVQILEKSFLDMGYNSVDLNSDDVEGFAEIQATQKNGERRSTNKAFLEPIRKDRPNLTVVTNVRVIEILIAPEKKTAYGIKFVHERNRGIKGTLLARNEVILSAGVFNSAQLLMLSGIGPRKTLSSLGIPVIQDLKVGYNLHDHPMIPGAFMSLKGNSKLIPKTDKLIVDGFEYQMLKRGGRWAAIGSSQMQLPMKTKYADEYPDVQMFFYP
ncbi:Glucose dehydrogenase [FAD, quinone] [Blattella germanica]|nr:Glucose dehydrogenase [FAD, quinone] [Blattella germanica]